MSQQRPETKRVRFDQTANSNSGSSSSKKARPNSRSLYSNTLPEAAYDDTHYNSDDNAALEADISTGKRRDRRFNTDGYGSEASDQDEVGGLSDFSDNEDDLGSPLPEDEEAEGDDTNMFDDSDTVKEPTSGDRPRRRRQRFLDIDEIEGQEMSSKSRVDSSRGLGKGKQLAMMQEDEEESDDDEGKTRIEAFNMRDDLEDGQFDAQGNFVWNKDPQKHQDTWLNDVSKASIHQARESQALQVQRQTQEEKSLANRWNSISNEDILVAIINMLRPRETVFAALARIAGPKNKKKKKKWGQQVDEKEKEKRKEIELLTELADQAMARGIAGVYEDSFEQMVRQMRAVGRIDDDWVVGDILPTPALPSSVASAQTNEFYKQANTADSGGLLDDLYNLP
ncbi:hypothetical protein GGI07_000551 [Coemansia sp. Benny D115]|nr:hypothetical protein GGI07_000551 [Coemansia sp. Benny D115]